MTRRVEPAGERLSAEIGAPLPNPRSFDWLGALGRLRRGGGKTAIWVSDRQSRRVLRVIDCGDNHLAQRTLGMIETDLRAKALDEFLADYGIDPADVA